jgi:chromate transporter
MIQSYAALCSAFGRIGLFSFGGPAAQIGLMHKELVTNRGWLSDRNFSDALAFCMLLPGPEAMQLATYCGWRLRGVAGGLIAGLLFVLPGALVIAALAIVYASYGQTPDMAAVVIGLQAAVIAIVAQALFRLAGRALGNAEQRIVATLAFLSLLLFQTPFPLVILCVGLWGWFRATHIEHSPPPWPRPPILGTVILWVGLWIAPVLVLWMTGPALLLQLVIFFGLLALVTFGGAYAVLAYMAQQVVGQYKWLTADQMIDALGLAETTPGPLILVTQFVGMMAGHGLGSLAWAITAGCLTLWMTFIPCFLWIFAGAPFIEALGTRPRPKAALAMISAAVVGVMAHLSLWFAFHVLFNNVERKTILNIQMDLPIVSSLDPLALVAVTLAVTALFWLKWSPVVLIAVMGAITAIAGRLVAGL